MRALAAVAGCLVFVSWPVSACSLVEVVDTRPSSQNARITVLMDGKPQKDVKLVLSAVAGELRLTMVTDASGTVKLPRLPDGRYCIVASASPTLRAELCLDVSKGGNRKPSSFSMTLSIKPPPPPTLEDLLAAAEKGPLGMRTQVFAGIVQDPLGAPVLRAQIAVYSRGSLDKTHPLRFTTDEQGRFFASLESGAYTAVFQAPGFRTEILTFEIAPDAEREDLHLKLRIGMIT